MTVLLAAPGLAGAAGAVASRSFDARVEYNRELSREPGAVQTAEVEELRGRLPSLRATYDPTTGVTRTLWNAMGYISDPVHGAGPAEMALDFARRRAPLLGLEAADLEDLEITDTVFSRVSGATRVYFRQRAFGLPQYNGQLQVTVNRDGRVVGVNNGFLGDLARSANTTRPGLDAAAAVRSAAWHLGLDPEALTEGSVSEARLMWLAIRHGEARLVWNFQLATPDLGHHFDFTVDAVTGRVWTRLDWVADADYRVYPQPVESPNHTLPPPPADGRVLVADPQDAVASPFGWHDTNGIPGAEFTNMRGNNVHAYDDIDANNQPPPVEPDCGASLVCDFPIDLTQHPSVYTDAAVANLFYWNNIIHDIQYQYGFDEPAGNFQVNNYGNGGLSGDDVRAEAQDGAGINDANFFTPPDGSRPRMQMFLFNITNPWRDGDFDSGIIVHEYGHGIGNRLVGGPSNVSCLSNLQQPGEGLSDWWFLAYTGEPGDAGTDVRGAGTYVLGQPPGGPGVRPQPYCTDPAVNTYTYESINGLAVPHGVGSVWAQAAWEVYWALVDHHGFDPDLYDALGGGGNQRMMLYVNEGLKNSICSPAFTDVRDGILQAAVDNHGGEDVCRLWQAFAAFGLGVDAVSGGPHSLSPTNGFAVPPECESDVIFADGFESGDISAWSSSVP